IWSAPAVAACPRSSAVRDYPPEGGQLSGSDPGRPQDGIPSVHELGGVYVAVAGWSAGGEWKVALTSQKVTKGTQNIALSTSLPGGWLVQSGSPVTGALAGPDRGVGDQAPAAPGPAREFPRRTRRAPAPLPRVTGGFAGVHPVAARGRPSRGARTGPRRRGR